MASTELASLFEGILSMYLENYHIHLFACQTLKQFGHFISRQEPVVVLVKVLKSLNISDTSFFKFVRLEKPNSIPKGLWMGGGQES